MRRVRLTCPHCQVSSTHAAGELVVAVVTRAVDGVTDGLVLFRCAPCGAAASLVLDPPDLVRLLLAGVCVLPLPDPATVSPAPAPARRPADAAPPLSLDDLIELHLDLERDDWLGRLVDQDEP